jgi:hypothetical protein
MTEERCAICQCRLHRTQGTYALHNAQGRSHATAHHFVAELFFGRSSNRKGTKTEGVFLSCPWGVEGESAVFCYECHEELLHNPVLLPDDIKALARIVRSRGLSEDEKTEDRSLHAARVKLFREIIAAGISALEAGKQ